MTTGEQQQSFEYLTLNDLGKWLEAPERVSTDVRELEKMLLEISDRDEEEFLMAFKMAEAFYEKAMRNTGNNINSFMSDEMMTYMFSFGMHFKYFFQKNLVYFVAFCQKVYSDEHKKRFKSLFGYDHDKVKDGNVSRIFADVLYVLESDVMDIANGEGYRLDGMDVRRSVVEALGGDLLNEFNRLLAEAEELVRINDVVKKIVNITSTIGLGWLEGYVNDETLPEEVREMASEKIIEIEVKSIRRKVSSASEYIVQYSDEDPLDVIAEIVDPLKQRLREYEADEDQFSVDERIVVALKETISALNRMKLKFQRKKNR